MGGSPVEVASGVQRLRQAEVERRPAGVADLGVLQAPGHRGQFLNRQLVLQEGCRLDQGTDVVRVTVQYLAEAGLGRRQVSLLLQEDPQGAAGRRLGRVQLHRSLEAGPRLLIPSLLPADFSQAVVGREISGIKDEGRLELGGGLNVVVLFGQGASEVGVEAGRP